MEKNYYKILGVKEDASIVEITKAYRKKVKEYHPEATPSLTEENAINEIKLAYENIIRKKENIDRIYDVNNLDFGSIDKDCVFVGDIYVVKEKIGYDFFCSSGNQTDLKLKMRDAILLKIGFDEYINLSKINSSADINKLKKKLNDPLKKDSVIIMGDYYKPFVGTKIALNIRLYNEIKSVERLCEKELVKKHKKFNLT